MKAGWFRIKLLRKWPNRPSALTRARGRSSFGECLEDRHLLSASLTPLSRVSVPSLQGLTANQGYIELNAVEIFTNGRTKVSRIELFWSGPLSASLAKSKTPFEIETANRKGSFIGNGSGTIAIRKVQYDAHADTVTITPSTLFSKFKIARLLVYGTGRKALKDSTGLPIVGDNGPGTDATWSLTYP